MAVDLDTFALLTRLFAGLPRKGPGLESCTLRALAACGPLPEEAQAADFGCGAGAATLPLARRLDATIAAVDLSEPFLAELRAAAAEQGLGNRLATLCTDFAQPPFPEDYFDLIWSEGAIFALGWEAGLRAWAPLLKPGGCLALTEGVWLVDDPPPAAREAWARWYPAITSIAANAQVARDLGLEVVETFPLPADAWWAYLAPLEARCADPAVAGDPALAELVQQCREEIALYRAHGASYGYAFFVLRKPG